ncbi:MAG: flagellar basal body-associated FliL family protein [Bdellovibrionota bacterium]|nr:MAG: flagellar basal body-associated FliL family protein [Bdellovibrionota bacterium]
MAEEKEEAEGQQEAAPPKSKKKLWIIIGGSIALVLLIGAPVAFFALKSSPETEELAAEGVEGGDALAPEGALDEDEIDEGEEPLGAFFPLDTLVVNLHGGQYIRTQIQLEFVERDVTSRFYTRLVPIRDAIITLLASKKAEDLLSARGKESLRVDIKDKVNEILRREEVKRVYFTLYVVQ